MDRDFEDRLRQSLQARAADVAPDPEMYREVQRRISRGRRLRWSLAGAGAVAMVAVAVLVVPALNDRRVEFEPAPVATQPPSEAAEEPAAAPPCNDDGDALVAVIARTDSDLHAMCASGAGEPLTATQGEGSEDAPALSPDGTLLAYESGAGHSIDVKVFDLVAGQQVETIRDAHSPAFSATGNLAFIRHGEDEEQPELVVREGEAEKTSAMVPDDIGEELRARHLVWGESPSPRILYWEARYEGTTVWGDDYIESEAWRFEAEPGASYAAPSSRDEQSLHLLRTCCVEVEGDAAQTVELGSLTLPDTDAPFTSIATLPDAFDASGLMSLAPAGAADIDQATGAWSAGAAPAWLVGDGDQLFLVDEDGNTDLVDRDITGVAVNPAAELPASESGGSEEPETPQVDVFFTQEGGECGEDVRAYPRSVEGPGVLRGALEHLLAGPTDQEMAAGAAESVFSDATAGALNSVTITENGVARVDFADFGGDVQGTSCTTGALLAQLDATVNQFPTVTEVVYSFDGSSDAFYNHFQLASPSQGADLPRAVARTQQRILDAVEVAMRDDDWNPLAELIDRETFSCSFSDQNEDCITLWRDQQAGGDDPLRVLAEILRGEPAKNPDAPIWVWPAEWMTDDEYLGPRTGIQRNGTWRYYQQGGD